MKVITLTAIILLLSSISSIIKFFQLKRPIIGILANPHPINSNELQTALVYDTYVKWLQNSKVDILPILPWYTDAQVKEILEKVNGVLYMGGDRDVDLSQPWEIFAKKLFDKVLEKNIPLWGTCQGFELIFAFLVNDIGILHKFDAWEVMLPIHFENNRHKNSLIYANYNEDEINLLKTDMTVHYHNLGIEPEAFETYPVLRNFIRSTSFGYDKMLRKFINTVEGVDGKRIFGVQFHPEKGHLGGDNKLYNDLMRQMSYNFVDVTKKVRTRVDISDNEKWKILDAKDNGIEMEGYKILVHKYNK